MPCRASSGSRKTVAVSLPNESEPREPNGFGVGIGGAVGELTHVGIGEHAVLVEEGGGLAVPGGQVAIDEVRCDVEARW